MRASIVAVCVTLGLTAGAIVNGSGTNLGDYPQVFSLSNTIHDSEGSGTWQCSSVLVAPNLLLTAAHCVMPDRVYLGSASNGSDVTRRKLTGRTVRLDRANANPKYVFPSEGSGQNIHDFLANAANDIGYVVLKDSITDITPMTIARELTPEQTFPLIGQNAQLIGFGPKDGRSLEPPFNGYGQKRMGTKAIAAIQGGLLIFNGVEQAALPGDSGGPVLIPQDGQMVLGAVISQFSKNRGQYGMLAANLLRTENLCWVMKDSGVAIPGISCP